jgi:hypothetical protein
MRARVSTEISTTLLGGGIDLLAFFGPLRD